MNKSTTLIICGPTSSGKTSLAIQLAKEYGADVLSADSRQIYKHMDIGTGKITVGDNHPVVKEDKHWVIDGVNIWGYDLVEPDVNFSSYDFALWGLNKLAELQQKK